MTKTAQRRIGAQVRDLRRQRLDWLAGRGMPWGMPWCTGPGNPSCQGPLCEGCACRLYCGDRAADLAGQAGELLALLTPPGRPVQEALW